MWRFITVYIFLCLSEHKFLRNKSVKKCVYIGKPAVANFPPSNINRSKNQAKKNKNAIFSKYSFRFESFQVK